jgi:hypothetical protein
MDREEFHLFDTTVGLSDFSKTNSISRNTDEDPLFLRVMARARAYFSRPTVAAVGDPGRKQIQIFKSKSSIPAAASLRGR